MVRSVLMCGFVIVLLAPTGVEASEWFVAPGGAGNGASGSPFGRIQDALKVAQPGDVVTIAPGTYNEALTSVRAGSSNARITVRAAQGRGSVIVTTAGRVLTVRHAYVTVDGLVLDGKYGLSDTVRVESAGSYFRLANAEVRRSTKDLIDMGAPQGVVIEKSLIHHALNAEGGRTDAHGIVAGPVRDLTIRDTEIHTFSGDGIQVDPGRSSPGWNNVLIERSTIWLAPLPAATNGFAAGAVPGENAVDTKASPSYARAVITIRDTVAYGFRGGFISNMAAFNLKEHVNATVDRVVVRDSTIAFRLRGPGSGGAVVAVKNAVVHDVATAFRYEDDIQNLRIWNSTIGRNVTRAFQAASSGSSGLDVRNLLVLGTLPKEAPAQVNLSVTTDSFVNASAHNYSLVPISPAVDAGVDIASVPTDITGLPRPEGAAYDIGAYEYKYGTGNQPPSVALTNPIGGASFTAPATITLTAQANDADGTVAKVAFYADGVLVGADASAPFSIIATSVPAGTHTFTAVATDNTGATTTSGQVQVMVNAPGSDPSTAWSFTANPARIRRGETSVLKFMIPTSDVQAVAINGNLVPYSCTASSCSGNLTVGPGKTKTFTLAVLSKAGVKYPRLYVTIEVVN